MRRCFAWVPAVAVWSAAWAAQAQVEVTWSLTHNRTLLMEPVMAQVRIVNYTGQALDLSPRGNARLTFEAKDQKGDAVAETGQPLVRQAVIIPADETRGVDINLLDGYRIIEGQSYMLTPVLECGGIRFLGQRLSLEVQPGIELLARNYGLPAAGNARAVSLRLIHREKSDRLFFRLDDPATDFCLGAYELGRVIRFFEPRLEQDRDGAFHVLHQCAPARFKHSVFSHDGVPAGAKFYAGEVATLRLERRDTGEVTVAGGSEYTEDPENPGVLIGPELPPSHSYPTTLGELPPKGKVKPKETSRGKKVE